ncbi:MULTISPECIES: thioesterase family protein [unclassified Deinococcus]|uniref:acyl-CoA thioesterase n=1 Tax=unclassified Deinococcus TaxID=2623546 RepID=UPI0010563945|nr:MULTISPECIES: thioesterase family protein [unclassified Deinococcus]MBI0446391.1 acyl-CoA thioesterase [Deinococcus sp. DB0503]TDE85097.1 acyl-CoA thioesterase [Deinococcus sp. S9]
MTRPTPQPRSAYPYHHPTPTRWADNDVYGHVNNVTYYAYFDTAVNAYLASRGALDIQAGAVIGLVVETGCTFFAPAAFPDLLSVGVRVVQLGRSSVRYELAVFRAGEERACAQGYFIHVYVDRDTRRPVELPEGLRTVLESLRV